MSLIVDGMIVNRENHNNAQDNLTRSQDKRLAYKNEQHLNFSNPFKINF